MDKNTNAKTNILTKLQNMLGQCRYKWLSWRIYAYAKANDTRGVRACLRAGVDANNPMPGRDLTPMHIAAVNGYHVMLSHLLAYGADIDQKAEDGNTMLGVALNHGQEKAAATLLAHGADPNKAHLTDAAMVPVLTRLVRLHGQQPTGNDYGQLSQSLESMFAQCRNLPRKRNFNGTEWGRDKAA